MILMTAILVRTLTSLLKTFTTITLRKHLNPSLSAYSKQFPIWPLSHLKTWSLNSLPSQSMQLCPRLTLTTWCPNCLLSPSVKLSPNCLLYHYTKSCKAAALLEMAISQILLLSEVRVSPIILPSAFLTTLLIEMIISPMILLSHPMMFSTTTPQMKEMQLTLTRNQN